MRRKKSIVVVFVFALLIANFKVSKAQERLDEYEQIPLNYENFLSLEPLVRDSNQVHTNVKPLIAKDFSFTIDTLKPKNLYRYKALNGHLLSRQSKNATLHADLLLNCSFGTELSPTRYLYQSSIGARFQGSFGKKLFAELIAIENVNRYPVYINSFISKQEVLPGNGAATFGKSNYISNNSSGYLNFAPNSVFNFQLGRGKLFFGDGYRSLLLSDNASNFNYAKINARIWKFNYTNLYTEFKDIQNANGKYSKFNNKYASMHYLSANLTKRINLSFFESVVWQSRDTTGGFGFDVNYLNPLVFYRPVEYSLGSPDNAFIGASMRFSIFKKQQIYAQVLLDEFYVQEIRKRTGWWANKQAFQVGFKSFDCFHIKGLLFQLEGNYVRPYTYSHGSTIQNYSNYGQALAHPMGANFIEAVAIVNYRKERWNVFSKLNYFVVGMDSSKANYGQDIFKTYTNRPANLDYGNVTTQGLKTKIIIGECRVSYLINPKINLRLEGSMLLRIDESAINKGQSVYFLVGLKSALSNFYYDF